MTRTKISSKAMTISEMTANYCGSRTLGYWYFWRRFTQKPNML